MLSFGLKPGRRRCSGNELLTLRAHARGMRIDGAASMLERLKTQQDRAFEVAARDEAILLRDDPSEAPALARTRWELMRVMMLCSAFKHGELFPAMLRHGCPDQIAATEKLRADCLAFGDDFKTYVARWSSVSVADHWLIYRPAALAMIARLRSHMARELRVAESVLATPARLVSLTG